MPTKTDRILGYLPGTFRAVPRPTALYSLVDAVGNDLLQAENSLAAVMQAHWVDLADRDAELIDDLARIASLYALAPRDDEAVEEFREHLKRYVRTFLDGTATVQGVLRLTAEGLGLHLADAYEDMDAWWTRPDDSLVTVVPRGDAAASLLLGVDAVRVTGSPSAPARVTGTPDLAAGLDLREASILSWAVDGGGAVALDLKAHVPDPAAATLAAIVAAINTAAGLTIAGIDGHHLTLASPTSGPSSRLEIQDVDGDAAPHLLGLPARTVHGSDATSAQVTGTVDLGGGVDLHESRYLRLFVDGMNLAEVDCAGPVPATSTLDQIRDAINAAVGAAIASHDGHFLTLASTRTGFASSIVFQSPAAQDATPLLFGQVAAAYTGMDAQPAKLVGPADLRQGVDLSLRSNVRVRIDGNAITVDCTGVDPTRTQAIEIVGAINAAFHAQVAALAGHGISVQSVTAGAAGKVVLEAPASGDATFDVLGIPPRIFTGSPATAARLVGTPDLSQHQDPSGQTVPGVDLGAVHLLNVALDGGPPVVVDLRTVAQNPRTARLTELNAALNVALGAGVASDDGRHLILTSPTVGAAGSVEVVPLAVELRRRFLTRAFITDEATEALFGFVRAQAAGAAATPARVEGAADLSRGVDLRETRFLRVGVDGGAPIDIDCAKHSARPRVAVLDEIVAGVNDRLGSAVASHDGRHLFLTSPTTGSGSRIEFQRARGTDVLGPLLAIAPTTVRGSEGTRVTFKGTVDLSGGVDLGAASHVKIGVDGAAAVEIACAGADPAHTRLNDIVTAVNVALRAIIATSDGRRLILTSPSVGANSRIEFSTPAGPDATRTLFGIATPRTYQGADPKAARVVGTPALAGGIDLSTVRFMRIAVDGGAPVDVDTAKAAADPAHATLADIQKSVNDALGKPVAGDDGTHLILTSVAPGSAGRLDLLAYTASDARQVLFGQVPDVTTGVDPAPAAITGVADLRAGVNLAERSTLALSVDGSRPVELDVAGAAPDRTFADEVVDRINAALPGVASVADGDHLRLTSPTSGGNSSLQIVPLRALELIEYPPASIDEPPRIVRHGDHWSVMNDGAADADLRVEISAPHGDAGPELVNLSAGVRVRVTVLIRPGERLRLRRGGDSHLSAEVVAADGGAAVVPGSRILAGPLGAQAHVPLRGSWHLVGGDASDWASLQLNNPDAPAIVILRARQRGAAGDQTAVDVVDAALAAGTGVPAPDGSRIRLTGKVLVDASGARLVDAAGALLCLLRPSAGATPGFYAGRPVVAEGPLFTGEGTPPVMVAERIARLFDVTFSGAAADGTAVVEAHSGVTIGTGTGTPDSLTWQVNSAPSQLVFGEEVDKGAALILPRGRSEWLYLNCDSARYDRGHFDQTRFAGGTCHERGIFDVSRFADAAPEVEAAVFAPAPPLTDPTVEVLFQWVRYRPGAFVVNLPADLPEAFGARFDEARFGLPGNTPETFPSAVLEPSVLGDPGGDPDYLVNRINDRINGSKLVTARFLNQPSPPLGWEPMVVPFRHPRARALTLGSRGAPARIYLAEQGVPGLIELSARQPGVWGNSIEVTARRAGPARYDVTVGYKAARFESARQIAFAGQITAPKDDPLPALIDAILRPQPVGILHAKAAGVRADVTRDRTDVEPTPGTVVGGGGAPGFPGTYLQFDGIRSYVEVPDSDKFSITATGALTVSAWMKPDTLKFPRTDGTGYVHWLGKGEGSGAQGTQEWAFRMYSRDNTEHRQNRISFYVFNPEGHEGVGSYFQDPITLGRWIHVVGVADGERTYIYKNGVFRKCDQYRGTGDGSCESHPPLVITPKRGDAPLRMGHRDGHGYFLGGLAEIRVWNRSLSRAEIAALYSSGVVPRAGLVAEYLLDEGQSTIAHDTVGRSDGTIFGAAWESTSQAND
ncbi:MAG TPA: LamG domain-containing protein [bacterium]|nr:LamG domain-containing protein [bacterium]